MLQKGISISEDLVERIEDARIEQRDRKDHFPSFSETARDILLYGIVAHEAIEESGFDIPDGRDRAAYVRQAVREQVRADNRRD